MFNTEHGKPSLDHPHLLEKSVQMHLYETFQAVQPEAVRHPTARWACLSVAPKPANSQPGKVSQALKEAEMYFKHLDM